MDWDKNKEKHWSFQVCQVGVADGIVAAIRSRERNGLVELPKPPRLKRGDRVQIVQGPFRELLALYVGQTSPERVAVLLQFLGGQHRTELPASAIEPLEVGQ
jgi:transcriptional antiterminator RfaH